MIEETLIILKPDSILRGLVGRVFDRYEKVGLRMAACKMCIAKDDVIDKMYDTKNKQWVEGMGEKTIKTFEEFGLDIKAYLKTDDPYKIGMDVAKSLKKYIQMGPIIVTVWEGVGAVNAARKIRGYTTPIYAEIGSITGDFSYDSPASGMLKDNGRAIMNIAHTSGTVEEANYEIELWFGKDFKPIEYDRTDVIFF